MDPRVYLTATDQLAANLDDAKVLVICGRADDAAAWTDALGDERCLAIGLDAVALHAQQGMHSETSRMTSHHQAIASLSGSGWLTTLADGFDPDQRAVVVVPDPLDPPTAGNRRRVGRRRTAWRLFEDKAIIDTLWDKLGVPRLPCLVADSAEDLKTLARLVDAGHGVVCSLQQPGSAPTGNAEGICWWRGGETPALPPGSHRIKIMPLMPGLPVRLHGMVLPGAVIAFSHLEIVALPRLGRGTFLCCGTAAPRTADPTLEELTRRIGAGLRELLDYRGAFSVDGIMAEGEFRPTDLNTRLTSAMEAAPSHVRIQMQAANILAREGAVLDTAWLADLAEQAFVSRTLTLYGAASNATGETSRDLTVRWESGHLIPAGEYEPDGRLRIAKSLRGWTLVAELHADRVPASGPLVAHAPEVFHLSDQVFGTDFGQLRPPFGVGHTSLPHHRHRY